MSESLTLWRNAGICPTGNLNDTISPGTIAVSAERIVWIGPDDQIPSHFTSGP